MSERNGGGGPEARGTGSSLTDAVVAALANVSGPPGGGSPPPSDPKKDGAASEPARSAEAPKPAEPEPAAKVSPTVITGTPEPAEAKASEDAVKTLEPPKELADAPGEARPAKPARKTTLQGMPMVAASSDAPGEPAAPSADASAASAPEPTAPTTPGPVAEAGAAAASEPASEPAPIEPAPIEPAAAQPSTTASSEASVGDPTVRLGGAPIESLTKDAASAEAPEGIAIQYYGRTDVGLVREHNEDNYLVADLSTERRGNDGAILKTTLGSRGLVLAVCDGMGGAAAGEVASQMAVDTIHEILQAGAAPKDRDQFARRLVRAIEEAGARIFAAAKMDRTRRGMGTTSTVAGLVDSTLFVGQVGDSRAYVLRGDQFALITKDQSLVNQLIEAGQLTEEEAEAFEHSNIILQALGTTEEVTVDLTFLELRRGDRLLMCSDGLSGLVHADMMREVLKNARDLSEAAQQLIAMANAGGGHDNITVIVAEFDGKGLREASADARVAYQQYPLPPEDASEAESAGKSATSIKAGGPKPGADVKSGSGESPRESSRAEGGGSKLWLFAILALLVLVAIAAVIVMMDDGTEEGAADTTRVTIASEVSARPAPAPTAPAPGRVVVRTDAEDGELYVNGERAQALGPDGATLSLAPGAYRLELRQGDVRISESTVTIESGREQRVSLTMPAGAMPEPGAGEGEGAGSAQVLAGATEVQGPSTPIEGAAQPGITDAQRQQVAQQQRPTQQGGGGSASQGQPAAAPQVPAVPGQVL